MAVHTFDGGSNTQIRSICERDLDGRYSPLLPRPLMAVRADLIADLGLLPIPPLVRRF